MLIDCNGITHKSSVLIVEFVFMFQVPIQRFSWRMFVSYSTIWIKYDPSPITSLLLHLPQSIRWLYEAAWILALSYLMAYLETLAIANVCSSIFLIQFCLV
jgi:hypothetical protein